MFQILRRGCVAAACLVMSLTTAQALETRAKAAFVIDMTTGTVLLTKNADDAVPPASMSKLMTLYIAFEALRDGRLRMDETLPVSQHAMNYGGSTLFLKAGERVKVEDLLRGIIVLSGNDACAVLAEALSPDGTEGGFARYMTQRAQQLGMTNSTFKNSNGWPAPGHVMSMRDLALLAKLLIEDFPEHYPMFSQKEFLFDEKEEANRYNRNPLLGLGIGADGLKTGHTAEAGYGLVGSAKNNNRRVIFAITGLQSAQARAEESEAIVNWAFRQFAQKTVVKADTTLASAEVWLGAQDSVDLVSAEDVDLLVPTLSASGLKAEVVYTGPFEAPIKKGQALGELIIQPEGLPVHRVPLVAAQDVAAGGFVSRVMTASETLIQRLRDRSAEGAS